MLLEETLMHLLRYSGYELVTIGGQDPTLRMGAAGLEVRGRGDYHQIDAIADFKIPPPFANPGRLLVEAKFLQDRRRAGIDVIRNAVGVLKDLTEYWAPGPQVQPRYHYQYAVCSATGYSEPAERYAAAHDVYLIQFAKGGFFAPVLAAIRAVEGGDDVEDREDEAPEGRALSRIRESVRGMLAGQIALPVNGGAHLPQGVLAVVTAARGIGYSLLAVAMGRLPLILTPARDVQLDRMRGSVPVRITWDEHGWYLNKDQQDGARLFSFDLPATLFRAYANQGELTPLGALDLKQKALRRIDVLVFEDGGLRLVRFELNAMWIEQVRAQLAAEE